MCNDTLNAVWLDGLLPVYGHGCEVENAGGHGDDGNEVVDGAVDAAEDPLPVPHVNVVENAIEHSHQLDI